MPKKSEKDKIIKAVCENYTLDLLLVDSSDEEEEDEIHENFRMNMICLLANRRSIHLGVPKSSDWHRKVLRNFDDDRFIQMVRVRPAEFEYILDLIKDDDVFKSKNCTSQLPIDLQLEIVLFRLGSSGDGLTVRKVATLFGLGDGGTIQKVTKRVFKAILKLKPQFLKWPNEIERLQLVSASKDEMPGCVGYIDGSEIKLAEAPIKKHELYYSRKRQYSIKVQAVCDYKLRIMQLTIGYPGSVHDAKMFSNCPLSKYPHRYLSDSEWIAGDSAYPLCSYLITPFRRNSSEHTQEARRKFNRYFSTYRVRIENCFGDLKEKFASLKEIKFRMINERNKKECNEWIMVCCTLHNICINFNMEEDEDTTQIIHSNLNLLPSINRRNSLLHFIQNRRRL